LIVSLSPLLRFSLLLDASRESEEPPVESTLTSIFTVSDLYDAVIVAVPLSLAVITPSSTVATEDLDVFHVAFDPEMLLPL